MRSIGFFLVV